MITRADISKGYQAVQSCHAVISFLIEHKDISSEWYNNSNYIGLLSVKDERELFELINKASKYGIRHSIFREPDIGNEITSIVLEPGQLSKRICSSLPLALSK